MNELVEMLNENFFDDNESPARFDFTPEFLKWYLPGLFNCFIIWLCL